MQVIALFNPRGGAGRTTTIMALASGYLSLGKRVLMVDCTLGSERETDLSIPPALKDWQDIVLAGGVSDRQLGFRTCREGGPLIEAINAADEAGYDVALLDTRVRPEALLGEALARADLILLPATRLREAVAANTSIETYFNGQHNAVGLITGCRHGPREAFEVRQAFGGMPVLRAELSWSDTLACLVLNGDLHTYVSSLACEPGEAGYGLYRETHAAWTEVLTMTTEVHWALQGLLLSEHVRPSLSGTMNALRAQAGRIGPADPAFNMKVFSDGLG